MSRVLLKLRKWHQDLCICALSYVKQTAADVLLCNTGILAWRSVKTERGTVEGEGEGEAPE